MVSTNGKLMIKRRYRKGRRLDGILVLNKPIGISSNAALQRAKHLFMAQKAGHTGSLDPLASGVLPLCFGEATKFSQFLLNADKKYLTTIKLGATTTTGDVEGKVLTEHRVVGFTDAQIEQVLDRFRGKISQIPSMYSAIKVAGKPLYKLARQGLEIERLARTVQIHKLLLLANENHTLNLEIVCSKGTYIRTLAEDIGKVLGCGAHVIALQRLGSGPFDITQAINLEALAELKTQGGNLSLDSKLMPPVAAIRDWPKVELTALSASYLQQGQPVQIAKAPTSGWVSIFSESSQAEGSCFIGIGEIMEDGRVTPRRLVTTH